MKEPKRMAEIDEHLVKTATDHWVGRHYYTKDVPWLLARVRRLQAQVDKLIDKLTVQDARE